MKFSLTFFLFFLLTLLVKAQTTGSIGGKLKDETTGELIEFAAVNLVSTSNSAYFKNLMTENDGTFLFDDLPFGSYRMKISFVGYESRIIENIRIDKGNANQNLGMVKLKQASNVLDELIVTAPKSQVEFKGDTVVYNVSQSLLSAGSTATDVLKNVPMVNVDIDGKATLAGKMNTRVFIDSKPSDYTSATIADLLNVLPADAIDKVEVITNPDVKYSADGDGIINIVLKKGYKIGINGALSLTASTLGNYNANLYSAYRDERISLSGSYGFKEAISRARVNSLRTNFNTLGIKSSGMNQFSSSEGDNAGHNARVSLDLDITKEQNLRVSANFNTSSYTALSHLDDHRLNSSGIENELRIQDNNSRNKAVNGIIDADYNYKISKQETLTAGLTYYQNDGSYSRDLARFYQKPSGSPFNEFSQNNANAIGNSRMEISLDYKRPLSPLSTLLVGVQSSFNKNSNDQRVYGFDFNNSVDTLKPGLTNKFEYNENIVSAYASYSLRTKKKISFRFGVRTEYTGLNFIETARPVQPQAYFNFFPNISINKVVRRKHNFGLSYGRRITRPREYALNPLIDDSNQSNVSFGNPELLPSYTDQFQFSFGTYGKNWSFTPRISYAHTGRIIERFRISPDTVTFRNIATNRSWSYNMFGNYRPTKKVTLTGGLSVSRVAYESDSPLQPDRKGYSYRANGALTGQFKYNIAAEGQLNYYNNTISQGRSESSVSLALGARKTFLGNKLLVRILANDPFTNLTTLEFIDGRTLNGSSYKQERTRINTTRNYSLTLSYRFTKVGRNTVNKQKADADEAKVIQ